MSREALYKEITNLERKVNLLIAEHSRLKEQIEYKEQNNKVLQTKLDLHEAKLRGFQSKETSGNIVGNTAMGKADAEEMKKVLDGYINEVDKCIAHLGDT